MATGKEQKIRIESSSGLSEDEIDKMVSEAEAHSQEDEERKKKIEVRNNADSIVYTTEKTLKEHGDKISSEDKAAIETAIADLKKSMENDDTNAMEEGINKVTEASHKLAEAMYQDAAQQQAQQQEDQAGAEAPGSAPSDDTESKDESSDDTTVDADFTVVDDDEEEDKDKDDK